MSQPTATPEMEGLSVLIPADVKRKLMDRAQEAERSLGAEVRLALREYTESGVVTTPAKAA